MVFKGSVKSEDYVGFLSYLIKIHKINNEIEKNVFFQDNAKIHKSKHFWKTVGKQFAFMFNAPYSPQLNAIEYLFNYWKMDVK